MTFMPANGCFIDYGSGGSLTMRVLLLIKTADPKTIIGYANSINHVLQTLESLRGDLAQVPKRQLPQAWPTGAASQAAQQRLNWLFSNDCFGSINKGAGQFAGELGGAAGQLQKAQQIYNTTVSVMNAVVGALLSNPFTHGAGVALANTVVNIVDGFMKIIGRILDALHVAKLVKLVHDVIQVVESVKKIIDVFHGGSGTGTPPTFPNTLPTTATTPPFVMPSTTIDPISTTTGTDTTGTGVNGTGVNGTGVNGTGVNGTGVNGTGVNGTGVNGTGVNGTGVNGTGVNGVGGQPTMGNHDYSQTFPGYNTTGGYGSSSASNLPGSAGSNSPGWVPVSPTDPGTAGGIGGTGGTTGGAGGTTGGSTGSTGGTTGTGAGNGNAGGTTGTGGSSSGGGDTITIEVSKDGLKVRTPGDLHQDFNIHVDATVDGEKVSGDVNIDV